MGMSRNTSPERDIGLSGTLGTSVVTTANQGEQTMLLVLGGSEVHGLRHLCLAVNSRLTLEPDPGVTGRHTQTEYDTRTTTAWTPQTAPRRPRTPEPLLASSETMDECPICMELPPPPPSLRRSSSAVPPVRTRLPHDSLPHVPITPDADNPPPPHTHNRRDCGLHYLGFALVCFLIRSPRPSPRVFSSRQAAGCSFRPCW